MQLTLFAPDPEAKPARNPSQPILRDRPHVAKVPAGVAPNSDGVPERLATTGTACEPVSTVEECRLIAAALRTRRKQSFLKLANPILTAEEKHAIAVCEDLELPWQAYCHAFAPIVDRLTSRWGELTGWEPFARVIEPSSDLTPRLRVVSLKLFRPSRGLSGQIAFAVTRRLEAVREKIPLCVLELLREHRENFTVIAYLEPIFETSRTGAKVLRSQREVRRIKCKPKDPLVVGLLGLGPFRTIRVPKLTSGRGVQAHWSVEEIRAKPLIYLLGHWD